MTIDHGSIQKRLSLSDSAFTELSRILNTAASMGRKATAYRIVREAFPDFRAEHYRALTGAPAERWEAGRAIGISEYADHPLYEVAAFVHHELRERSRDRNGDAAANVYAAEVIESLIGGQSDSSRQQLHQMLTVGRSATCYCLRGSYACGACQAADRVHALAQRWEQETGKRIPGLPSAMPETMTPASDEEDSDEEEGSGDCGCDQCDDRTCDGDCGACSDHSCSQCWPDGCGEEASGCCGYCAECDTHSDGACGDDVCDRGYCHSCNHSCEDV